MVNTQARTHRLWLTPYGQLLRSDGLKRLTEQMLSLIAQRRGESFETEREAKRQPQMTLRQMDRLPAPGDSLAEHLSRQVHMGWRDPLVVALGDWIVWNLDSDGYLREDLDDLAAAAGASVSEVETGLAIVQSLEPTGVAARSLRECLLLQLHAQAAPDPVAIRLVDGHLAALAAGRHGEVARSLDLPLERIERALAAIRRLEPRPGRPFGTPRVPAGRSWAASHRSPSDERRMLPRSFSRRPLATPEGRPEAALRDANSTVAVSARPPVTSGPELVRAGLVERLHGERARELVLVRFHTPDQAPIEGTSARPSPSPPPLWGEGIPN